MPLTQFCREQLEGAEAKALATYTPESGINVVPVSSLFLEGDTIILVNYFFGKTLENIKQNPEVSLSTWSGLRGCQVKATAAYEVTGERFAAVQAKIKATLPDRVVKGILVLTPHRCFNVSAGSEAGKELI